MMSLSNFHEFKRWKGEILEDFELEALLAEESCQTQEELAESLGVNQQAILKGIKSMGMIQKKGNWVSYELKLRDVDFAACQRSVPCCKTGENLLGNAKMGGLTPLAVLSRRYNFTVVLKAIKHIKIHKYSIRSVAESKNMSYANLARYV